MNEQFLIWLLSIVGIVVGSAGIGYVTGFRHGWRSGFDSCSAIWNEGYEVLDSEVIK